MASLLERIYLSEVVGDFETLLVEESGSTSDAQADSIRTAFDRVAVVETITRTLADSLTLDAARALETWMDQPAVRRAQRADSVYLFDPNTDADFEAFGQALGQAIPLDTTRAQLTYYVEESTRGGEVLTDMTLLLIEGFVPEAGEMTADERAELRATMLPSMQDYSVLSTYYIYQDLTLEELAAYAQAVDTPEGVRYYQDFAQAFSVAVSEGIRAVVEVFELEIDPQED